MSEYGQQEESGIGTGGVIATLAGVGAGVFAAVKYAGSAVKKTAEAVFSGKADKEVTKELLNKDHAFGKAAAELNTAKQVGAIEATLEAGKRHANTVKNDILTGGATKQAAKTMKTDVKAANDLWKTEIKALESAKKSTIQAAKQYDPAAARKALEANVLSTVKDPAKQAKAIADIGKLTDKKAQKQAVALAEKEAERVFSSGTKAAKKILDSGVKGAEKTYAAEVKSAIKSAAPDKAVKAKAEDAMKKVLGKVEEKALVGKSEAWGTLVKKMGIGGQLKTLTTGQKAGAAALLIAIPTAVYLGSKMIFGGREKSHVASLGQDNGRSMAQGAAVG